MKRETGAKGGRCGKVKHRGTREKSNGGRGNGEKKHRLERNVKEE